ncbi:hypothetical protein [Rhodobium gokarnense]|uniref:Glycerophosphoryl diester phosphodiesterase membrane domain-containing protein n=1 Tax=Rhodobium gokarnense TaxID=364296 RepID=A0ABT3H8J2_9HYPH|nr:hypothetical protein [Rhodobium gokarnense]MCW2306718.1 hypothetical protein [Rhodobium gokarnense]
MLRLSVRVADAINGSSRIGCIQMRWGAAVTVAGSASLFQLVSQSLAVLARHPAAIAYLFLPFAVSGVVGTEIFDRVYPGITGEKAAALFSLMTVRQILDVLAALALVMVVQFYFYLKAALGLHRYLLLGERPWSRGLRLGRTERRFFYRIVSITLIVLFALLCLGFIAVGVGYVFDTFILPWAVKMPGQGVRTLLWVRTAGLRWATSALAGLLIGIIVLRLSVALVDRALGRDDLGLRQAWAVTAPWRGRVVVFAIVAGITGQLGPLLPPTVESLLPAPADTVVSMTVSAAFSLCMAAFNLTAIALLYRKVIVRTEDVFA